MIQTIKQFIKSLPRYSESLMEKVSIAAVSTEKDDTKFWNDKWVNHVKPGEKWDCRRTEIMLQDMLDNDEIKPLSSDSKVLIPGVS